MKHLNAKNMYPCKENLYKMKATEKGKFCSSCDKEVINFTHSSIQEIINTHKASETQVCGIYAKEHFNVRPKAKEYNFLPPLKFMAAGLLAFTIPNIGNSHINIKPEQVIEQSIKVPKPFDIRGTIIGDNGKGIAGARIYIAELDLETTSDNNGAFHLILNDVNVINSLKLIVSHENYKQIEQSLNKTNFNQTATATVNFTLDKLNNNATLSDSNKINQTTLNGIVTDKHSGEPLPFCSIRINSETEIITDLDGKFSYILEDLDTLTDLSIVIKYIGYKEQVIKIKPNEKSIKEGGKLTIELEEDHESVFMGIMIDPSWEEENIQQKKSTKRVRGFRLRKK